MSKSQKKTTAKQSKEDKQQDIDTSRSHQMKMIKQNP